MNYFYKRGKNFYEWPHYNNHKPKVRTKSMIKLYKTSTQYDTYSSTNIFLWPFDCSFCTCTIKEIKENSIKLNISFMTPTGKIQINSIKMHRINCVKITNKIKSFNVKATIMFICQSVNNHPTYLIICLFVYFTPYVLSLTTFSRAWHLLHYPVRFLHCNYVDFKDLN